MNLQTNGWSQWRLVCIQLERHQTAKQWNTNFYFNYIKLTISYLIGQKAYSEFSKSALVRSSSCRLYHNRIWKQSASTRIRQIFVFKNLQSGKEKKHDFYFFCSIYNRTIIGFSFCDNQNNQGLGKGYNPYLNLHYSG